MNNPLGDTADNTSQIEDALPQAEEESFETVDHNEPIPPEDIIAYNEVRSCADLYRLFASNRMEVQPDFQREVVWNDSESARFIDSLVKQLPIPSMCFSLESRTQRWKVIDGLQRMTSIIRFLGNDEYRLVPLVDIHPLLRDTTNIALRTGTDNNKVLYSAVENVTIPVTVIRCDYSKREHMRYLFTIFHRLNSGGVRLNNQEIRNCIYTGPFNTALREFDSTNADWQVVKSRIWGSVKRFRSVEVLLRVLAFSDWLDQYDGNLADFLNRYMHNQSGLTVDDTKAAIERLALVSQVARAALEKGDRGKLSLAVVEALLVGINNNIIFLTNEDATQISARFNTMLTRSSFAEGALYAVSSAKNVESRLRDAINAFAEAA